MLRFTKMNGAGNDFVMIDNRAGDLRLAADQIAKICDRHRGVGADGVLVLERPTNGATFRMRYYNADGGEAEMCGNGARCFARYASRVAGPVDELSFETPAGVIGADLQGELVCLQMSEPTDLRLGIKIPLSDRTLDGHFVNSGVPHVVIPVDDLENVDVRGIGSATRRHELFQPKGANVNFLKRRGDRQISIRTYERGVENETLACGTGVVASALVFAATEDVGGPIGVLVRGGNELKVGFDKVGEQFKNVTLTGPADFVFEGTIEL
jgi:diaminopimelate epimerase